MKNIMLKDFNQSQSKSKNKKNNLTKWYVIKVYPGFENKVVENLQNLKLENIFDVISVVQDSNFNKTVSKKKTKKINLYPGYIFINMIMSNEILLVLKSIPGIISYSLKEKLVPVSSDEMEAVLKRIGRISKNMCFNYDIGDTIKIINGPFSGDKGKIISINKEAGLCKIEFFFMGKCNMEVELINIEKV